MLLGILSDTHNRFTRTALAIELLKSEGAEVLVHCGDLTEPEMVSVCSILPCYYVFGNNDADDVPLIRQAIEETNGICLGWGGEFSLSRKRIAVTHGHMNKDLRRLLASEPDYLLSGHSHIPHDYHEGRTRRINPGALRRADRFTVALLDLETDELKFIEVPR
jgi:uncharacterized protein